MYSRETYFWFLWWRR